jgi:hypothetical protein
MALEILANRWRKISDIYNYGKVKNQCNKRNKDLEKIE